MGGLYHMKDKQDINFNALYYKQRAQQFTTSVNYVKPSEAKVAKLTNKRDFNELNSVLAKAAHVKGNVVKNVISLPKYEMIGGVPHKRVNGALVPLKSTVKA